MYPHLDGHARMFSSVAFSPAVGCVVRWRRQHAQAVGGHERTRDPHVHGHSDGVTRSRFRRTVAQRCPAADRNVTPVGRRDRPGDPHLHGAFGWPPVAFSPDGRTAMSASADKTLKLWDVANRTERPAPSRGIPNPSYQVAFSP